VGAAAVVVSDPLPGQRSLAAIFARRLASAQLGGATNFPDVLHEQSEATITVSPSGIAAHACSGASIAV
jgi:hypothetical protein